MGKKTPLYDIHKAHKGQIIEFGGWDMPVFYTGMLNEHRAVREKVGVFDVSHMGEIEVTGRDSLSNLQRLLVSNIEALPVSRVKYSVLCYPEGGVVDDVTVYRLENDRFLLCVNASNTDKDYQWISQHLEGKATAVNRSSEFAQLAIQGPRSMELLQKLTPLSLGSLKYYWFVLGKIAGVESIISRTGYTGEDGFELYFSPEFAIQVWEYLMAEGEALGIQPIGLGARDTLRMEMAFPLYGHELDESTTLLEAGLGRLIDFGKPSFLGKEAFTRQKAEGTKRKLVGFKMVDEGIPRPHYEVYENDKKVGFVTSGTISPTLRKGIGMGYVGIEEAWEGNEISIMIRQKKLTAEVVRTPFYNRYATIPSKIGKGDERGATCQTG